MHIKPYDLFMFLVVLREQGGRCKQSPRRAFELGGYREDEAFMEGHSGIDEAGAASAVGIQRGTEGRHELRWVHDPQIMEGEH